MTSALSTGQPCYSGIYGTCSTCNNAGSCICSSYTSGHSDLLTMDRTRWGGIVYVCPTISIVITAAWALNLLASCIAGVTCIRGLKVYVRRLRHNNINTKNNRIVLIFVLLLLSSISTAGLSVSKLIDESNLIGIDLIPSLLFTCYTTFDFLAAALNTVQLTATALSTQESTLGRTRIQETITHELRYSLCIAATSIIFGATPAFAAAAAKFGLHSETQEKVQFFLLNVGGATSVAVATQRLWFRTKDLERSFMQSIAALEASLLIAAGGASVVERQRRGEHGPGLVAQDRPEHLRVIDDEIDQLRTAKRNLHDAAKTQLVGLGIVVLMSGLFVGVPYFWNKLSYSIVFSSTLVKVSFSYQVAATYLPVRKRSTAWSAATPSESRDSLARNLQIV